MIGMTILLGAILLGVVAGFFLLLRIAFAQEGRTLRAQAPGRVAAVGRRITGLYAQRNGKQAGPEDGRP